MNPYLALVTSISIGIAGQITLKHGAMNNTHASLITLFSSRFVLAGLVAYGMSAILYIYSLKSIPVSAAFSSVSISYFFVALTAHYLWGEPFGIQQIIALLLISTGVYLMFYQM